MEETLIVHEAIAFSFDPTVATERVCGRKGHRTEPVCSANIARALSGCSRGLGLEAILVMQSAQDRRRDHSVAVWDATVIQLVDNVFGWIRNPPVPSSRADGHQRVWLLETFERYPNQSHGFMRDSRTFSHATSAARRPAGSEERPTVCLIAYSLFSCAILDSSTAVKPSISCAEYPAALNASRI